MRTAFLLSAAGSLLLAAAASANDADSASTATPDGFEHISCLGKPNEVRVRISNVKESVGVITVETYRNDPENFLRKEGRALQKLRFAARAPETRFCLYPPESDLYAIGVYHDENANDRLDKKALGLPAEPYGVSNNPRMRFAPPKIEEALFHVTPEGALVEIELRG